MNQFQNLLHTAIKQTTLHLTSGQINLMGQFAGELVRWNKKINLTAITDPAEIAEKHFVDSCYLVPQLQAVDTIMDMGTGGGFPGIVVKILAPEKRVVLVDSVRKKVNFLKHVIRLLGLSGIEATHARVEDLHRDAMYQGRFDAVVSRAFSDLSKFVALSVPFLNNEGVIIAMKGKNGLDEITPAIQKAYTIESSQYTLPLEQSTRYLITLKTRPD